jgi:Ca2+-binding EF-hand superfamily protein
LNIPSHLSFFLFLHLQEAGVAFNRALQKLASTLKTKPMDNASGSTSEGSFIDKLKYVYDKYDPNNDGLDISEFKKAMEEEGIEGFPPEMIENVFLILDPDHDGTVTLDEFTYAYFNRRKLQYAAGGEATRLEAQAKLRNKRRKAAIKKLMVDKFQRERESCLPPADPLRDNVEIIEANMGKIAPSEAMRCPVTKDFDPNSADTEEKVAWSFQEQDVPLMGIKKGEIVLIVQKGCGRDRRWCVGMSADRTLWGFFPMWCVDHMTAFLKLHNETKLLQKRQKLRDAERQAKLKKNEIEELSKCSFKPNVTAKAKEMGAKKSEVVVVPFDVFQEQKLVRTGFAKTNGPPAPPLSLAVGDRVEVIERRIGLGGRWCLGRLPRKKGSPRSATIKGVFPRWCIGENSHFNRMHEEGHRIEERRNARAAELENVRDEEFTFHPKTNRRKNLRMLKGYEERREEREQKRIDKHIDHLFKECTFQPKLLKHKHRSNNGKNGSGEGEREQFSYMRKKERTPTMPEPTLTSQGRLSEPVNALVVKPFQWHRHGAVSQMLVPAFGKNHPKPVSCYIKDKVLVLDTMCGRDGRWCLIKLGKDTGVCPMWILPANFQYRPNRKRHKKSMQPDNDDESGMFDSSSPGKNGSATMRSPQPPERTSAKTQNKQLSPNARRKKMRPQNESEENNGAGGDAKNNGTNNNYGEEHRTTKKTSASFIISEQREMARQIPELLLQIKRGLNDRGATIKKAFLMLDTEHNKVVNRHEFKAWLRKYSLVKLPKNDQSDRLMDLIFERMDIDRDGQITFAEFAKKLQTVKEASRGPKTHHQQHR